MHKIPEDIGRLLVEEADRINSPAFIADDPVQFPRRFDSLPDIEISGLLSATIAWGNRKMICRDCDRLLALMGNMPYRFLMEEGYEEIPDEVNIHRTFFGRNLKHYMRGLRKIYAEYGSIQELARRAGVAASEFPAWTLAAAVNEMLREANGNVSDSRCLPQNIDTTALKRVNMWLRWLVRRDGIVDLGVWDVISPSQLYIPLDVHVSETARELDLLHRKSNDRKAVAELTESLRSIDPSDPVRFDYALFGIGMKL